MFQFFCCYMIRDKRIKRMTRNLLGICCNFACTLITNWWIKMKIAAGAIPCMLWGHTYSLWYASKTGKGIGLRPSKSLLRLNQVVFLSPSNPSAKTDEPSRVQAGIRRSPLSEPNMKPPNSNNAQSSSRIDSQVCCSGLSRYENNPFFLRKCRTSLLLVSCWTSLLLVCGGQEKILPYKKHFLSAKSLIPIIRLSGMTVIPFLR